VAALSRSLVHTGMECTAAERHIRTVSFLLPAATEDASFPSTTPS